ncbi:MAG: hypothetical protein ACE5IY_22540 [bacterium]
MSIVVAIKKNLQIVLASDSQTNFGAQVVTTDNLSTVKIRAVGDSFLASTGWSLYDNILDDFLAGKETIRLPDKHAIFSFFMKLWKEMRENYSLVNEQCSDDDSPFGDLDASFLLANANGIFHVSSDMSVTEFKKYYAIGSGAEYGLGALFTLYESDLEAEAIACKAIDAARAFNLYCGGEIQVTKIPTQE